MSNLHVMLDFETWGVAPGTADRSIGAVTFDPFDWSHKRSEFYRNIIDERPREAKTVKWWSEQSAEAQAVFSSPWPVPLASAMRDFVEWFRASGATCIWSHGSIFDVARAEHTMRALWIEPPWAFRDVCDTRTIFRAACVAVTSRPGYNIKHHALHDAHNQAHAVELAFASLALHGW